MDNKKLKINYFKSHDFKVSLVSGVYGGLGSNRLINILFFNDRVVIPNSSTITVDEFGKPIGKPEEDKDGDISREVQFGAFVDINTAKVIVNWLSSKIAEAENEIKKK